jgi:hypothetical protein
MLKDVVLDEELLLILIIITISLIGSLVKNYYELLYHHKRMKVGLIILSTVSTSILDYSISSHLLKFLGYRPFIGVTFFLGLISMELLGKLSNLNDVFLIIKVIIFRDKDDIKKLLDDKTSKDKNNQNHTDNSTNNNINITIKK